METRRQPAPAVEVDADEDRLQEEGDAFDRKTDAENVAEPAHHARPEDPELEGEDRSCHGTYSELDRHDNRPAASQTQRRRIVAAKPDAFHQHGKERETHPEWNQDDVVAEREGHLLAAGDQGRRFTRQEGGEHHHLCFTQPVADRRKASSSRRILHPMGSVVESCSSEIAICPVTDSLNSARAIQCPVEAVVPTEHVAT